MSAGGMALTVLATGLKKHIDKFINCDLNELPRGSPESHYFMLEAAGQRGFEMIDDEGNVYVCNSRQIVALLEPYTRPIDMILFCPRCGLQHIDAPDRDTHAPCAVCKSPPAAPCYAACTTWKNEPHRTHLCHGCGLKWRPSDRATNGVAKIETKGTADDPMPTAGFATLPLRTMTRLVEVARDPYVMTRSEVLAVINAAGLRPLTGWLLDIDAEGSAVVIAPRSDPGGIHVRPDSNSLAGRLLYALVKALCGK